MNNTKNSLKELIDWTDSVEIKKGNGKTLSQLIEAHPEFQGSFLCNESDTTPLEGDIDLCWDDWNHCLGLHFDNHESFLNLPAYENEINFQEFYNTPEGKKMFETAYNFFTA